MEIDELLRINRGLKRRLVLAGRDFLYDSLGKRVNAQFIAADSHDVFEDPELVDQYRTQLGGQGVERISRDEAKIILGYDFRTVAENIDIVAMLDAVEGGFGGSRTNAYWLGANIHKGGEEFVNVPVAYFIIPKEEHKRLIIDPQSKEFRETIEMLKLGRACSVS